MADEWLADIGEHPAARAVLRAVDHENQIVFLADFGAGSLAAHDCRLAAAAPELLRALVALADEFDRYDAAMTMIGHGHEDYGRQRENARQAICNATGNRAGH